MSENLEAVDVVLQLPRKVALVGEGVGGAPVGVGARPLLVHLEPAPARLCRCPRRRELPLVALDFRRPLFELELHRPDLDSATIKADTHTFQGLRPSCVNAKQHFKSPIMLS
jgi:hypothetical protein